MPERFRRVERVFQRVPIYFVTTCTFNRSSILSDAAVHTRLVEFGNQGSDDGAWLGAYVLMPDHLHAFVAIDVQRLTLSMWIKSLKNALSKTLRLQGVPSPHWQKGFFDHILRSAESYGEKWSYVRENPLRAGLVEQWGDWPFIGEVFDLSFRDDPI
jgi:REP element-mobilizing transposase RayT